MIRHKWILKVRNQLASLAMECDSCAAIEGARMTSAERLDIKPFHEVYSQEQIDEVDNRILEEKRKYDAKLYADSLKAKDFPMNN